MAKQSGLAQRLYVGGFDISGDVGSIQNAGSPRGVQEITGLDKSGIERQLLLTSGQMAFGTFFNVATDQIHDALKGLPRADVGCMWLTSVTVGDPVAMLEAKQIDYNWNRGPDGSLVGTTQMQGDGAPLEWGELLLPKTTHSTATDGSSVDNGASTSNGAVGYMQQFGLTSGTAEYDIEDSTDDAVFANLIAFTDRTTDIAVTERVHVTGTVNRYVRASTNGTFTNAIWACGFRRKDAADVDIVNS